MNKELKRALKSSFSVEEPQHYEEFARNLPYPRAKISEFMLSQVTYIRKPVWLMFLLWFGMQLLLVHQVAEQTHLATISALTPLLSLFTMTELLKSTSYHMEEMELSCKYNLPTILWIRLSVIGICAIVLVLALQIYLITQNIATLWQVICLLLPYLATTQISLVLLLHFKKLECIPLCSLVTGCVSFVTYFSQDFYPALYENSYYPLWFIAFLTVTVSLVYYFHLFLKEQEQFLCNSKNYT